MRWAQRTARPTHSCGDMRRSLPETPRPRQQPIDLYAPPASRVFSGAHPPGGSMFIRLFLVALGCMSFAVSLAAADEIPVSPAADAHRPHRWSLQFQVGDNFRVSGFGGAGLAVTRNLDADDAWRFGLGWNGNFAHQESFSQQLQADTVAYQIDGPTRDEDRFSVTAD